MAGHEHVDELACDEHVHNHQHAEVKGLKREGRRSRHRGHHNRKPHGEGNRKRLPPLAAVEHHKLATQADEHRLQPKGQRTRN